MARDVKGAGTSGSSQTRPGGWRSGVWWWLSLCALTGCAGTLRPAVPGLQPSRSAPLALQGIGSCEHEADSEVALDPDRPLVVLVHGWHSSAQSFGALVRVFEQRGQQTVCFRYDDRARVTRSAAQLRRALVELSRWLYQPEVIVLGHSQGGLVARTALTVHPDPALRLKPGNYHLVTVSSPFGGIRAATSCGSIPYHLVSLGVSAVICRAISGPKWNQIHPHARLIQSPFVLDPVVREHLTIVTDERATCRRMSPDGQRCVQDDFVFSVAEQRNERIEHDHRVVENPITAGHVAAVGANGGEPRKLLEVLERHGLLGELQPTLSPAAERLSAHGWLTR